jgi:phosphoglycolate phosphatase
MSAGNHITSQTSDGNDLLLLFDFDGVIADSMDAYFSAFVTVCQEMGYNRLNSREAFLRLFEGNLIRQLFWAGFPIWRLKRLVRQFEPRIIEAHSKIRPFAALPEILNALTRRFPVFVITSNIGEVVLDFLNKHGIEGVIGVVGSDTHASKVRKIRSVMKEHPSRRAFYISDTKGDLIEARRAGASPIAVSWGWHSVEKLAEGKPEHIIGSPDELQTFFQSQNSPCPNCG